MLTSKKLELRRSEIRQELAELANIESPSEDETRKMSELDVEYRAKETQYRAAIIAEDEERREAGAELETRSDREWADLMAEFEMRQVVWALDEGRQIDGATGEIVSEMREKRGKGGGAGIPVPWESLEVRNTVSAGTPDPVQTRPIIDRLFPDSVAARMGAQMINIGVGEVEWPVVTSAVSAGWTDAEGDNIPDPTPFSTVDRPLAPDQTMGVQMRISRKALKQSGSALEQAIRRDMNGAMNIELDRVVFNGTGANGQPLGVVSGAASYGIAEIAFDNAGSAYADFRAAAVAFINANAATGPGSIRVLSRPEMWDLMDDVYITGTAITEWDRLVEKFGSVVLSNNALEAPSGSPTAIKSLLTTTAGGVAPIFVGAWGGIDLIRDPYSDAQSGGLRITALATMDQTVARSDQLRVLTGIEV